LFIKPLLLLLDEPTNHLDLEAVVWLEAYLSKYPHCLVLTSHSQDFLNNVCSQVMDLTVDRKLVYYGGNYDTYVRTKEELETNQTKAYYKQQDEIAHIKKFIASAGTYVPPTPPTGGLSLECELTLCVCRQTWYVKQRVSKK